ncbi:BBSome complex assembly protein BBS10 [Mycteria americana]|uniref:BBSome complex assembly protein BBS10 n=1 Tax=Mycteria americana TaxID=33587 RepID=UPI003F581C36
MRRPQPLVRSGVRKPAAARGSRKGRGVGRRAAAVAMARRPALGRLAQEAAALAGAVRGALGPRGGRALVVRPAGQALLTRDGRRLLEALSLEPPTARMMAACACSHSAATGDGAKTFVVLLAGVLGGLRAAGGGGLRRALRAFEAQVLERAVAQGLRGHLLSALPGREAEVEAEAEAGALQALLEAYLGGRLGPGERRRLARLCCEYCRLCAPAAAPRPQVLRFLSRRFAELHVAVAGLPVGSSRVLPGLILRRDFAAYCPAGGDLRAVLVTEPLRPALSAPGVEFVVDSEGQYQASLRWISRRTEALMKHLQSNSVKLLLSSVKQEEVVIYYAKLYGVSVVECLSSEEMALICEITGVSPYTPFGDNILREITETAVATFCRPLLLGSKRCVHIGFTSVCAFQPHCLILCGPVDGVNEQHAAALQGAFTMLQQLFKRVDRGAECKAEAESQNEAAGVCSWRSSATQKQLVKENISCSSNQVSERQLKTHKDEIETQIVDPDLQGSENPACVQTNLQVPSNPVSYIKEFSVATEGGGSSRDVQKQHAKCEHPGDMHENYKSDLLVDNQKNCSTAVSAAHNASIVAGCERLGVGKDLEKTSCNIVPFKHEKSCVSIAQNYSNSLIEAGSVLPVGGYFEILLHYYIQYYAKQLQQSEVTVISNVVADALLSIPKSLYRTTERNSFTKFYLKAINALRKNQPLAMNEKGLESVYCKYQLVISVLHCVTELLSIDLIIGVKRPPQKIEDNDSEDDF